MMERERKIDAAWHRMYEEGSMVQLTTISVEREKEKEVFRELRKSEEEISAIEEDGFWLLRWKRYKGDTVVHVVSSREFEGNKETIPSAKDVHVVMRPGSKIPAEWFRYLKIVQR